MCEKKMMPVPELNLDQCIVFQEIVCSHEFADGCKELSEL